MTITTENIILIGSVLVFISVLAGKTSFRIGVPTLIFFLAIGMLAGLSLIHISEPTRQRC
ncbi:MAG: potassium/proton antiporter, partial [Bacteroidota bacterium]|nr:potassium/proton antiporter [Bacteroidota bacterium]